jgi:LPXTG-site transpeptidase (sortase) family protein
MKKYVRRRKHPVAYLSMVLLAAALIVLGIGLVLALRQHQANSQAARQAASHTVAPSTKKPAPAEVDNYTVAPDRPRYITIPKLGVRARVQTVGLTKNNQIGSPANVYDAAWYTGTSKPGQPGVSLIDGHVSSWTTKGIFYRLGTLQAGDAIQITLGNNTLLNYSVVKTRTYDSANVDMTAVLSPADPAKSGLNLITCTGDVIKGTNEFNKRVVVFAEKS